MISLRPVMISVVVLSLQTSCRPLGPPVSLSVRRTDCGKLAPYVDNHYRRHDQGGNVRYTGGARVDEGVGHVDCPTIALRHDARRSSQGVLRSHQGADW